MHGKELISSDLVFDQLEIIGLANVALIKALICIHV